MRQFDLTPLYRSTIGFDRLGSLLDTLGAFEGDTPSYPPYNIERVGENEYRISMAVAGFGENDLAIEVKDESGERLETIRLGLARFKRPIRDYFAICESYFRAVRAGTPGGLETIDMARRGVHNGAAELLQECLDGKVELDFDTARRLFTLICVLHIK